MTMTMTKTKASNIFLLFVLTVYLLSAESRRLMQWTDSNVFDVVDYGAIGDGFSDDTQAFSNAWDATCNSSSPSPILRVPQGKSFVLQPITFYGEDCRSNNINFQIDGNIIAPSEPHAWKCDGPNCDEWITFKHFDGLFIYGSGTINGQGTNWWKLSCEDDKLACGRKPTGFIISHSNNVHIDGLTFEDSPQMHVAFESSTWVYATHLTIRAPEDSPNTDGIHIQHSTNVFIDQTRIGTGDDCVSIGDGSSYLNITNILCGPGHGISIGSLGKNGENETVEFVHVSNVFFAETMNGVRIKTWQGGRGYARNIVFEHIQFSGSNNPIIIDQYYCPHDHCANKTSAVQISNVSYNNMYGTSSRETAVELACSTTTPCTNITMKDINLHSSKHEEETSAYCLNVQGLASSSVSPAVPCLLVDQNL